MGMKQNFTPGEWENLISLPYAVSMTVMVAVPSILGFWGETKAILQEPAEPRIRKRERSCWSLARRDAVAGERSDEGSAECMEA